MREVIQSIVDKISYMNGFKKAWLEKRWIDLVGEEAGKHSRPYRVEKDILFVSVDSSVWNQQLFMNRSNLIDKINNNFARKIVEDVKCQIGYFSSSEEKVEQVENKIELKIMTVEIRKDIIIDKNILRYLQRKKCLN